MTEKMCINIFFINFAVARKQSSVRGARATMRKKNLISSGKYQVGFRWKSTTIVVERDVLLLYTGAITPERRPREGDRKFHWILADIDEVSKGRKPNRVKLGRTSGGSGMVLKFSDVDVADEWRADVEAAVLAARGAALADAETALAAEEAEAAAEEARQRDGLAPDAEALAAAAASKPKSKKKQQKKKPRSIIDASASAPDDSARAQRACKAVADRAAGSASALADGDLALALLSVMGRWQDDLAVQEVAFPAARALCDADAPSALVSRLLVDDAVNHLDMWINVIDTLGGRSRSVQVQGITVLGIVVKHFAAASAVRGMKKLKQKRFLPRIIKSVLRAMDTCELDIDVCRVGAATLHIVAKQSEWAATAVMVTRWTGNRHAIDTLTAALKAHPADIELQRCAIFAAATMRRRGDDDAVIPALESSDLPSALLAALETHPSDSGLVRQACSLLAAMAGHSFSAASALLRTELDAGRIIAKLAAAYADDKSVAKYSKCVLRRLKRAKQWEASKAKKAKLNSAATKKAKAVAGESAEEENPNEPKTPESTPRTPRVASGEVGGGDDDGDDASTHEWSVRNDNDQEAVFGPFSEMRMVHWIATDQFDWGEIQVRKDAGDWTRLSETALAHHLTTPPHGSPAPSSAGRTPVKAGRGEVASAGGSPSSGDTMEYTEEESWERGVSMNTAASTDGEYEDTDDVDAVFGQGRERRHHDDSQTDDDETDDDTGPHDSLSPRRHFHDRDDSPPPRVKVKVTTKKAPTPLKMKSGARSSGGGSSSVAKGGKTGATTVLKLKLKTGSSGRDVAATVATASTNARPRLKSALKKEGAASRSDSESPGKRAHFADTAKNSSEVEKGSGVPAETVETPPVERKPRSSSSSNNFCARGCVDCAVM